MLTITVRFDEKRATTSQYENLHIGTQIEATNLELASSDQILAKTAELFALAKASVERELAMKCASPSGTAERSDTRDPPVPVNGNGHNGNGGATADRSQAPAPGRRFGRPDNPPTDKQRVLLSRIARDRHLGPESIREICERVVGQPVESLDRLGMSRLLEGLINGEAA